MYVHTMKAVHSQLSAPKGKGIYGYWVKNGGKINYIWKPLSVSVGSIERIMVVRAKGHFWTFYFLNEKKIKRDKKPGIGTTFVLCPGFTSYFPCEWLNTQLGTKIPLILNNLKICRFKKFGTNNIAICLLPGLLIYHYTFNEIEIVTKLKS